MQKKSFQIFFTTRANLKNHAQNWKKIVYYVFTETICSAFILIV